MTSSRSWTVAILSISLIGVAERSWGEVDLSEIYPATLEWTDDLRAWDWMTDESNAWRLNSFEFALHEKLPVKLGPSRVVFGVHDTNVLWAAVLSDEPAMFTALPTGRGEHVTSIWMRFHPARLGELFPAETVEGRLEEAAAQAALIESKRMCGHKMRTSFHVGPRPMLPPPHVIIIDMETLEGPRRFFVVNTDDDTVDYEGAVAKMSMPVPKPISRDDAVAAFDEIWHAFDREYAMFAIKQDVDWAALRERYRPMMDSVETSYAAAAVISSMLVHLEDLHVWVRLGEEFLPGYRRDRPLNGNGRAVEVMIPGLTREQERIAWGRTNDGIGYIVVFSLGDSGAQGAFDKALNQLGDTWALIVDLRINGGGSETLAQQMTGRFLDRPVVYAYHQYRSGPSHDELTPMLKRTCSPRGPWRYESPVIALQGQRTFSSAEAFALMMGQCDQVTTMGDRTAGSSGNPRRIEAPGGITVNLPRWLSLLPDHTPLEGRGAQPDIRLDIAADKFTTEFDPVLAAALKSLRTIPVDERVAGRRTADDTGLE